MADRVEPRHEHRHAHGMSADKVRSYIHQLYGGERPERAERQRHSAPTVSDPVRAREAAASASRASRLSEQRPFWHTSLAKARQLSRESAPPAEVLDRAIADKLETLTKAKASDSVQELTVRNVARHDKRVARPVSSRERQQRIASWLQQVERALGERRRLAVASPQAPLCAELPLPLTGAEPRGRTAEGAERRPARRP
ncbi:uncharacterized protein LOC122382353 [Amphibalanus amphitrite]|uniref:uncharacterized protein LOC122381379 n=1 Tax=Amphibalanus amphitrite TaxID=1232801 RepID=UPI001C91F6F5|nr:uncharacterized protein LOC122381379 [Amphibalanus amphitrite]XP_043223510.1 uncharacterized protein LOC122382353 [Amphibalanus amphitrite]